MPVLTFLVLAVVALVLGLAVACDRNSLPKVSRHPHLPYTTHTRQAYLPNTHATSPAPAPDMTSPLVLAAQPQDQSAPEVLAKVKPAARAARAEAPPKKRDTQPPVDYRPNYQPNHASPREFGPREFGLSGL